MMHQYDEQIQCLKGELQEKILLIDQQNEKLSIEIEKLQNELREKQEEIDTNKEESERSAAAI